MANIKRMYLTTKLCYLLLYGRTALPNIGAKIKINQSINVVHCVVQIIGSAIGNTQYRLVFLNIGIGLVSMSGY